MNYAHRRKIFHRDIKPANILLTEEGTPKIVDFGLAKAGVDTSYSMTGFGMGTMAYAAPEQKRDAKNVDHRADIYALGATLYEMITGSNPSVIKESNIPSQLKSLILKCVEEKPENRYFSIDEMLSQIDKIRGAGVKISQKKSFGEAGVCPQCQYQNSTDVKFCQNCGAGLTEKCLKCQYENTLWSKRCGSCGVVIEDYKKYFDHLKKGKDYLKQQKYSRATKEYNYALKIYPDNIEVKEALLEVKSIENEIIKLKDNLELSLKERKFDESIILIKKLHSLLPTNEFNDLNVKLKKINNKIDDYIERINQLIEERLFEEAKKCLSELKKISSSIKKVKNIERELNTQIQDVERLFEQTITEYNNKNLDKANNLVNNILNNILNNYSNYSPALELKRKIEKDYKEILVIQEDVNETNGDGGSNWSKNFKES